MNESPPRVNGAIRKRRSYSLDEETQVKRFATDLREDDSGITWTEMMKEIKGKYDIGKSVAQRMLSRDDEIQERIPRGRPTVMTERALQAWGKALKIVSDKRQHVGLLDVREIVCFISISFRVD